jgi:hypothetical protein
MEALELLEAVQMLFFRVLSAVGQVCGCCLGTNEGGSGSRPTGLNHEEWKGMKGCPEDGKFPKTPFTFTPW